MLASTTKSQAASSPKTAASPAESSGGLAGAHSSERRPSRRRSRSGSTSGSVGTSPSLAGPLHSPQEQHCAASWGTSASQLQNSSATRCSLHRCCVSADPRVAYCFSAGRLGAILRSSYNSQGTQQYMTS